MDPAVYQWDQSKPPPEAFEMGTHQPHGAELAERPGTPIPSFAPFRALVSWSHLCTLAGWLVRRRAPMCNVTAALPTAQC